MVIINRTISPFGDDLNLQLTLNEDKVTQEDLEKKSLEVSYALGYILGYTDVVGVMKQLYLDMSDDLKYYKEKNPNVDGKDVLEYHLKAMEDKLRDMERKLEEWSK